MTEPYKKWCHRVQSWLAPSLGSYASASLLIMSAQWNSSGSALGVLSFRTTFKRGFFFNNSICSLACKVSGTVKRELYSLTHGWKGCYQTGDTCNRGVSWDKLTGIACYVKQTGITCHN